MNINELREYRDALQREIAFCPPENAPLKTWARAEAAAARAARDADDNAFVFALLDEVDALTARLDKLERLVEGIAAIQWQDLRQNTQTLRRDDQCPGTNYCFDREERGETACDGCEYQPSDEVLAIMQGPY